MKRKKLLFIPLIFALCLAFAACGSTPGAQPDQPDEPSAEAEPVTEIVCGTVSVPIDALALSENPVYYPALTIPDEYATKEHCIAIYNPEAPEDPILYVYNWPLSELCPDTDAPALEDAAAALAELYSDSEYSSWSVKDDGAIFMDNNREPAEGMYPIFHSHVYLDGDSVVMISQNVPCDEVQIGDSGWYLWLPCGYEAESSADGGTAYLYPEQRGITDVEVYHYMPWTEDEWVAHIEEDYPEVGPCRELVQGWLADGVTLADEQAYTELVKSEILDSGMDVIHGTDVEYTYDAYMAEFNGSERYCVQYRVMLEDGSFLDVRAYDTPAHEYKTAHAIFCTLHTM